jgi:hypothetical protein
MPQAGQRQGYRPIPRDFAETFVRVGWEGIEAAFRAHKTTIKRWMIAYGEAELIRRRRALEALYAARGHRVPGMTPGRKLGISVPMSSDSTIHARPTKPPISATAAELAEALAEFVLGDME